MKIRRRLLGVCGALVLISQSLLPAAAQLGAPATSKAGGDSLAPLPLCGTCLSLRQQARYNPQALRPVAPHVTARDEDSTRPIVVLPAEQRKALAETMARLNEPLPDVTFTESRLDDAMRWLQDKSGVTIRIDERALADESIDIETKIKCHLLRPTLRQVLNTILNDHGLAWVPGKTGGVSITTETETIHSQSHYFTVVYPIGDLDSRRDVSNFAYEYIVNGLMDTVEVDSWFDGGGTGQGRMRVIEPTAALVVENRWDVQERVYAWLQALRQVRDQQGISPRAPLEANSVTRALKSRDDDRRERAERERYLAPRSRERTRWESAVPLKVGVPDGERHPSGGGFF